MPHNQDVDILFVYEMTGESPEKSLYVFVLVHYSPFNVFLQRNSYSSACACIDLCDNKRAAQRVLAQHYTSQRMHVALMHRVLARTHAHKIRANVVIRYRS